MSKPEFQLAWDSAEWDSFDSRLSQAYRFELDRQRFGLEMIASENYVSKRVLQACGGIFTNKYAEGYPGKRYYGGCQAYDDVENYAIELACRLFDCTWANVQTHSGSNANMAAYEALMKPGDVFLAMDLSNGGHLSHGSPVHMSGKWYRAVSYGLTPDHRIDFEQVRKLALANRPKVIVCGATCFPRVIDFKQFAEIAKESGAVVVADIAHIAGLVATGVHPSPIPHCDVVTSTTHKTLRGPRGGLILGNSDVAFKAVQKAVFPGMQGGPLMHQIMGKAVCFKEALEPEFKAYARRVVENAQALAVALMEKGLELITGGTDNHLVWVSLVNIEGMDGKTAQHKLEEAGITVNKNTVPNDPRSPMVTSGIRIGTAACTTRGMGIGEMKQIGSWVVDAINSNSSEDLIRIRSQVKQLCLDFPIYSI